ncbi:MAG: Gfo/Idh/MocA family oxidoreductase [Planctomycetes bacterium]|nr:Gfo/Idh/MocA family oxidoreductase [Planctomycetota bacterium]
MARNRRTFLKSALASGVALTFGGARSRNANETIRIGVIGVGSNVKIGGKGRSDAKAFASIPGVRVVALCDCDTDNLARGVEDFRQRGETVKQYVDFRHLLEDREIDAVSITTPNHWHSLMTIIACRAGKDVFVQKPASHNLLEGRKMVEAMRKYNRIVQATHGPRGNGAIEEAFEYARAGNLGKILSVRGVNYKPRMSIGKVAGPQPIPKACNYDLWCGPAPKKPLMREYLHYDWHWDWDTGDGDLGNMGIHYVDACRWALGKNELPRRVVSIGGRLGYEDDGQTPNTLITLFDYEPAPIIFEVRGLPKNAEFRRGNWTKNVNESMDRYRGVRIGTIVLCEGGYVHGDAAYDPNGRQIKKFTRAKVSTKQNFIDCIRSRKSDDLHTDALQGHLSCGLVHMANISHRVGRQTPDGLIRETIQDDKELQETFQRMEQHLAANRIDRKRGPLTFGAALDMDPKSERFMGAFADEANRLAAPVYRKPFVVPEKVSVGPPISGSQGGGPALRWSHAAMDGRPS